MSTIEKLITAFNNLVRVVYMDGQFGHVEGLMYTKDYKVIDAKNDIEFINKTLNELKDNESKYPDLFIQWRIGDYVEQTDYAPGCVRIDSDEDAAFEYWLLQDRTNGSTKEITIKPNEFGEYDITELVNYIGERWIPGLYEYEPEDDEGDE
jgi:hypothetical protein